jgi:NAD-dependent dihydropyrimidine dehydrogenase PreA subunit/predicted transcriptional regulator
MIKSQTVYRELQRHLDKLPVGFPQTESGVEIRILKLLFSPKEAIVAMKLKIIPETIRTIFRRVKKEVDSKEELRVLLDNLVEKGAIFGEKKGKRIYYRNALFIIGVYEFQVTRLTSEFMELMHQYIDEALAEEFIKTGIHQLRTIPIEKSLSVESKVYKYDDIIKLVKKVKGPYGVAECVCRIGHDLLDQKCTQTELRESCLVFRQTAKYYINHGYARPITREESIEILRKAEEAGLVLQPGNSKRLGFICTCCGCCCEGLKLANKLPRPSDIYISNYHAEVDANECSGCNTCIRRCQMKAISRINDVSSVNLDFCIGCGLCVTTCPEKAITLKRNNKRGKLPRSRFRLVLSILRRKSGNWVMVKYILKLIFSLKLYYILKKK